MDLGQGEIEIFLLAGFKFLGQDSLGLESLVLEP